MGHKVHPRVFRLGVTRGWDAVWFANGKQMRQNLKEDVGIRAFLKKELKEALVDRIEIERSRQNLKISIFSAKPGLVIGRAGAGIEELSKKIKQNFFRGKRVGISINVKELSQSSLFACVVGQQMAAEIEKRMPFRRVMKSAVERVMKAGAKGVKVMLSGRLNGAEIARTEMIAQGKTPLHNLRSDIDFASVKAQTIWGSIGVKVWINRGEVFEEVAEKSLHNSMTP
ncbi:30S ribosomal protein S3 [Candidatus Uhrbacteria bacterium]|nr:30S ribosomal protein S3 [Candidatus Uhrbacteria bacterium]